MPRLPVFEWAALAGGANRGMIGVLDGPQRFFTTSGSAAIHLALRACGVGTGDLVLLPTLHCPTMVSPVVALGATPLFYPLAESGRIDLASLDALPRAKALIAAHFFSHAQPMAALRAWCDARGLKLIEDCAHTMFGRSDGRRVGAWGDYAIASLPKFLPCPEGGCLVAAAGQPVPALAPRPWLDELRCLFDTLDLAARHGRPRWLGTLWRSARRGAFHAAAASADAAGSTNAEAAWQAAPLDKLRAGRAATRLVAAWAGRAAPATGAATRRAHYERIVARLGNVAGLRPLHPALAPEAVPYVCPIWVLQPDPGYAVLRRRGIPVSRWDWRWPGVPQIEDDWGQAAAHHVLQLACHASLTTADIDTMIDTMAEVFGRPPADRPAP